jgi:hypothetical protein
MKQPRPPVALPDHSVHGQAVPDAHWSQHGIEGLTPYQRALLDASWPYLDEDWAASPYFGTVREHARAYVERLARVEAGDST